MKILHAEASPGWGGQELRILREAQGMRERGHEVILAIQKGGGLVEPARKAGFTVYELEFKKSKALQTLSRLVKILRRHQIELLNTHSSLDAWMGGIAARMCRCPVIRTRHLSTPIRQGLNSRLLYNTLADYVVTTCQAVVPTICEQAKLTEKRCLSIPTGVNSKEINFDPKEIEHFRAQCGAGREDLLIGTLCVLRGWKGVVDLLEAANLLRDEPRIKWVVIGTGASEEYFRQEWERLNLKGIVHFAGFVHPPYAALAALDVFTLLSWAHEGVSQASLQAAWLKKPLITTSIGGLPEVCIEQKTGFIVPPRSPEEVSKAVKHFLHSPSLIPEMGEKAHQLVESHFTLEKTLDKMETIYRQLAKKKS